MELGYRLEVYYVRWRTGQLCQTRNVEFAFLNFNAFGGVPGDYGKLVREADRCVPH